MNLYLRLLMTWWRARHRPSIRVGERISIGMRVWPNDIDINGHMNNGRYLTLVDLAIVEYFIRAGLLPGMWRFGWRPVLGASAISFRRSLKPFTKYTLELHLSCWDERWSYLPFEFRQAGRCVATGQVKGTIVGRGGIVGSEIVLRQFGHRAESPPMPETVHHWNALEEPVPARATADRA